MDDIIDGVQTKSIYSKVNKNILINKLEELEQKQSSNEQKIKSYDSMVSKYNMLKDARKEDRVAIDNANLATQMFQKREVELVDAFKVQISKMQTDISEQSQTILTLFEMMDNSINQQIFYYTKFKEIYVNTTQKDIDVQ